MYFRPFTQDTIQNRNSKSKMIELQQFKLVSLDARQFLGTRSPQDWLFDGEIPGVIELLVNLSILPMIERLNTRLHHQGRFFNPHHT